MLSDLPELFNGSQETDSCLGSALQAAYKMVSTVAKVVDNKEQQLESS